MTFCWIFKLKAFFLEEPVIFCSLSPSISKIDQQLASNCYFDQDDETEVYLNEDEKELIRDNREKYFSKSVYFPNSKLSAYGLYLSGKHKLVNFLVK